MGENFQVTWYDVSVTAPEMPKLTGSFAGLPLATLMGFLRSQVARRTLGRSMTANR